MSTNLNYTPSSVIQSSHYEVAKKFEAPEFSFYRFSNLDEKTQQVALKAIALINQMTTTDGIKSWHHYTTSIMARLNSCPNAKNTLFIALSQDQVIGYAAFYTRNDNLPHISQFLNNDSEAYCSWVAIDPQYRGKGVARQLQEQIFIQDIKFESFKEHIKKTNETSLHALRKMESTYSVTVECHGHQYYCSVTKK